MQELIGCFVKSKSGRDTGKCYVIIGTHSEYVYLVDGNIRTLDNPKKKNVKHIIVLDNFNSLPFEAIYNKNIKNEEIKRAIKLLQIER